MSDDTMTYEPSAASMLSRKVPRGFRWLIYLTTVLFAAALCWAARSSVDIVVSGPAVLRPVGEVAKVQAAIAGTVAWVEVRENQQVRVGDVLIRLSREDTESQLAQLLSEREFLEKRRRHLDTERTTARSRGNLTKEVHRQRVCGAEIAVRKAQLERQQRLSASAAAIATCEADSEMKRYRYEKLQRLAQKGAANKLELTQASGELKISEAAHAGAVAEAEIGEGSVEMARQELQLARENARLAGLEAEQSLLEVEGQLANLAADRDRLDRRIDDLRRRLEKCDITASVSGTIVGLRVSHVGEVVGARDLIATIVPCEVDLQAEVHVPDRDIAFVEPGQTVSLRLAALPHGQYGQLDAQVIEVSEDVVATTGREPTFVVRCRLACQTVRATGREIRLRPGMTAEASITSHRQSPLSLLTGQLRNLRNAL